MNGKRWQDELNTGEDVVIASLSSVATEGEEMDSNVFKANWIGVMQRSWIDQWIAAYNIPGLCSIGIRPAE